MVGFDCEIILTTKFSRSTVVKQAEHIHNAMHSSNTTNASAVESQYLTQIGTG